MKTHTTYACIRWALVLCASFITVLCISHTEAHAQQTGGEAASDDDGSRPKLTRNTRREALERQGDYVTDKQGRTFRISFPLYERFFIEAQTGALPSDTIATSTRSPDMIGGRIAWNKSFALDFSDEDIWWMMRHRFFDTRYARRASRSTTLHTTLLKAQYLRHDLSSFVIVPAANDLRLPANFDIATDYEIFDITLSSTHDGQKRSWSIDQLDVAHIAILMDFIRDEDYRHRFAIGIAGDYQLDPLIDATTDTRTGWRHEVSPLTSAKILHGWDGKDGRFRIYNEATCGQSLQFMLSSGTTQQDWRWRCQTLSELEWTPVAISDRPLSIPLELHTDLPLGALQNATLQATIGLRMSFSRR